MHKIQATITRGAILLGLLLMVVTSAPDVSGQGETGATGYEKGSFPTGTYVIPMDDKQADRIRAYGFLSKVLQSGTSIHRIIEPPDVTLKTTVNPTGELYRGGPALVMASDSTAIDAARAAFPTVTVDTLVEKATSDRVFVVSHHAKILVVYGVYGHTEDILNAMGVPYTLTYRSDVEANPAMLLDYDLVVDDCPGWGGGLAAGSHASSEMTALQAGVADNLRTLVRNGGEAVFTDIALLDLAAVFPGYVTVVENSDGTWDFTYHNVGEFPSQYDGPEVISIYTMHEGRIVSQAQAGVRVLMDSDNYDGEYRIGTFYFEYGRGIVEGFAFHPPEQTGESQILTGVLFGNKFIHVSTVQPQPTPEPPKEPGPAAAPEASTLLLLGSGLASLAGYAGLRLWARRQRDHR